MDNGDAQPQEGAQEPVTLRTGGNGIAPEGAPVIPVRLNGARHRNGSTAELTLPSGVGPDELVNERPDLEQHGRRGYAVIAIDKDDDLASVFGKIEMADSPRVALVARKGNRELATQLGMRRLQRHLDLSGRDLSLVTRSRPLRLRAREEGVPATGSLRGVRFTQPSGGLQLGWITLRLPTLGALFALVLFVAMAAAGTAVLFWYVPTAAITVTLPTEPVSDVIDFVVDTKAGEASSAKHVLPARRRETSLSLTAPGPASGQGVVPLEYAAIGLVCTNRTNQAVVVPKGSNINGPNGTRFTTGADISLAPRIGASGDTIALATAPGTTGNVPRNTVRGVEPPLNQLVTCDNPQPGEKGTDRVFQAVSEADVNFVRSYSLPYFVDAAKRQLMAQYPDETLFSDGGQSELTACTPKPEIGKEARYVEVTCQVKASFLMAQDKDIRAIGLNLLLQRTAADKMLLESSLKVTSERPGQHDETFDKLAVSPRVGFDVVPRLDTDELRTALAGKSKAAVERTIRERVPLVKPPEVSVPGWAPWLPRRADRITIKVEGAAP